MSPQKKEQEFDLKPATEFDLQPEQNSVASSEAGNVTEPPWYMKLIQGAGDTVTGIAKGLGNEAMNVGGMMRDIPGVGDVLEAIAPDPLEGIARAGRPGQYPPDFSMFNEEGQGITGMAPVGDAQNVGAGAAKLATYMLPTGIEARGAQMLGRGMQNFAPLLRKGLDVAGRTGIGAASGAGMAAVAGDEIGPEAIWGGAIPGATAVMRGPLGRLGEKMHNSALMSMGKALSANFLNRSREYIENKILQPLLDRGEMFGSLRSLEDRMRASAREAMTKRDAIRAQYPADYSIPMTEVEDALTRAREQFSGVTVGPGQTMPSGSRDIAKRAMIEGELQPEVWKASNPLLAQAKDVTGEEFVKQGFLPSMKGQNVLFDTMEDFKQDWAGFARQHGKYQGKKMVGQVPESTVEVEAKYEAANEVRELLKKYMPGEWDELNRKFHIDTQIADLAEQRGLGRMGDPAAMAETVLGEVPSAYPGRAFSRSYMKAIRSPAWNSSVANLKERIGKQLKTPQGFNLGQALSFLDGVLRKPDVSVDAPDQPGNTYDPASEDLSGFMATPEAQQPGGELEWDPQTQTFKPVR